jgi:hypothetical protein
MQDYRSTRHISFAPVVMELDIPIPPEFCKYEPLSINHAPIHSNHGNAHGSIGRPPDYSPLHRKPYYVLKSSQHITDDSIIIGQATMVGSRWRGYSKSRLQSKDHIGQYNTTHCRTVEHTQNNPCTGENHLHSGDHDETDVSIVDSCHAHFVDEATIVDKKNCKLILQDGQLSLVTTKTIEPGDQLLVC